MGYEKKFKEYKNVSRYEPKEKLADVKSYPSVEVPERKLSKETCEKFGVKVSFDESDGQTVTAVYFPYYDQKGKLTGYKKRNLLLDKSEEGHFTVIGTVGVNSKLFGQHVAEANQRKHNKLLYVEGEWDVLSAYQAQVESVAGTKYSNLEPFVVGLNCGTANAVEATLHNENFIKSFDSLVFGFDNDSATPAERKKGIKRGVEARNDVSSALVGSGLSMLVVDYDSEYKDPSDYLQYGCSEELAKKLAFGARPYSAEKIVKASDISFDDLIAKRPEGIYVDCFPKLMEKLHGFRLRELVLLTSPSGVGKSTVTSFFANAFVEQGERTGMIYLEEQNKETLQRMVAHRLKVNYNKFKNDPLSCASREDIQEAYDYIVNDDKLVMLGHFGSLPITELMNKVKHMHLVEGCKYIILDHLSVVISGSAVDERKELDMVMTELAAFCAANDVCIIAVSHINRGDGKMFTPPKGEEDKPFWVKVTKEMMRGSAGLEQLSFVVIGLEPQIMPNRERGHVRLTVLKNRPWSYLGVADEFMVHEDTWEVLLAEDSDY